MQTLCLIVSLGFVVPWTYWQSGLAAEHSWTEIWCDMFHCRPLKPLPEHLSRPAALLIVGDISRFVCPFFSAAACSGSVAGRGCRRTEGWSVKKPIQMKTWRFVTFTQPASAFDPLNVSVGICAAKSRSVRSEAGQVFVSSPPSSSWLL